MPKVVASLKIRFNIFGLGSAIMSVTSFGVGGSSLSGPSSSSIKLSLKSMMLPNPMLPFISPIRNEFPVVMSGEEVCCCRFFKCRYRWSEILMMLGVILSSSENNKMFNSGHSMSEVLGLLFFRFEMRLSPRFEI